jgi:hypothetical protein
VSRLALLPLQGDKRCDEAFGYVCTPDTNVCWKDLPDVNGKPFGWSANVVAMSTNGNDTTVQFV